MVMGGPGFEAMSRLNIYDLALAVLAAVVLCSFKVSGRRVWHKGEGSDDRREHACTFVDAFVDFPRVAMFRKALVPSVQRVGLTLSQTQDSLPTIDFRLCGITIPISSSSSKIHGKCPHPIRAVSGKPFRL